MENREMFPSEDIKIGIEDKFHYEITDSCVACGSCAEQCPVRAITQNNGKYATTPEVCIDCGTCSAVCPVGAAQRSPFATVTISTAQYPTIRWSSGYK